MADLPQASLPEPDNRPAPAPKGWRRVRRRSRERSFNEDFPTLGAKLRLVAATAVQFLFLGLALLCLLATFVVGLFTDYPFVAIMLLTGAVVLFVALADLVEPRSPTGKRRKRGSD